MGVIGSVDFTEKEALFRSLKNTAEEQVQQNPKWEMLLFDEEKSTVWVCWK